MGRRTALTVIVAAALLVALFLVGPRVDADLSVRFDTAQIGDDPDAWLAAEERKFADIRGGTEKGIVWADPASKARTPLALIYVHGFSASRGETAPLTQEVAQALGANVFYTRLAGHGRSGKAMAEATVNDWVNDLAEALAIGRMIGEQIVVISTSTGGSLSAWGMTQPDLARNVKGLVMISPNFEVQAAGGSLLTWPWGKQMAKLFGGAERGFEPKNDMQKTFWTTRYPMEAVLPMAAIVKAANAAEVERAKVPALFIF